MSDQEPRGTPQEPMYLVLLLLWGDRGVERPGPQRNHPGAMYLILRFLWGTRKQSTQEPRRLTQNHMYLILCLLWGDNTLGRVLFEPMDKSRKRKEGGGGRETERPGA